MMEPEVRQHLRHLPIADAVAVAEEIGAVGAFEVVGRHAMRVYRDHAGLRSRNRVR